MKRETKKVTRKATKKRAERKPRFVTIRDVAAAALAEGTELHFHLIPDLDNVDLKLSEHWKDQVRQAAKLCGEPEEKILQRFAASFMRWKPTYLHIAEFAAKARLREELDAVNEQNKKDGEATVAEMKAKHDAAVQTVQLQADAVLSEVKKRTAEMPGKGMKFEVANGCEVRIESGLGDLGRYAFHPVDFNR